MSAIGYLVYSWDDETKTDGPLNILQSTLANYDFTYLFVIANHQIMFSYFLYGIRDSSVCYERDHIAEPKDGRE